MSKSLLVKIPSVPFHLETLRPDAYLAKLAAHLIHSEHETQVWDFGTLEMIERLYPMSLHKSAIERVDQEYVQQEQPNYVTLWEQWKSHKQSRVLDCHQQSVWLEIAQSLINEKVLDFIVFKLDSESDQDVCERIIPIIRKAKPHVLLVGAGKWLQKNSGNLPNSLSLFDCIYCGESCASFTRWVQQRNNPKSWDQIPYLAYSDGVRMYVTDSDCDLHTENVLPNYSRTVYPAVHDATKILYFDIEETTYTQGVNSADVQSATYVVDEIITLSKQFNTLAFHISGCSPEFDNVEALANELFSRHLNIHYTRECHVATTSPSVISALSASGCYSIDFQIDSGSQRLLDNYYCHPFGVTQIEQLIRACTFSNIFTVMNFSYPSVEDDYHTKAETFRLIQRSKPSGALIEIPPQEHRNRSDLKARSNSRKKLRSQSEIRHEHDQFCGEIESQGISTQVTPPIAMMAKLSGCRGQEEEFLQVITYQLMAGDVPGIQMAIEKINQASRKASNTISFTPFKRLQFVVGN